MTNSGEFQRSPSAPATPHSESYQPRTGTSLNEGRDGSPGNTSDLAAEGGPDEAALNEGRDGSPGNTTVKVHVDGLDLERSMRAGTVAPATLPDC